MKILLITCSIFLSLTLSAQYSVETVKHTIGESDFEFPVLNGPDSLVVNRINRKLQSVILDHDDKRSEDNIFEELENQYLFEGYTRTNDVTFEVNTLSSKLFSIQISADFCGAYCEWATMRYVFNLNDGNRIKVQDVFKYEKHQLLLDKFNASRKDQIERFLIQFHLENENKSSQDQERIEETIWLYNECLNNTDNYLNSYRFQISGNRIHIYRERCASHILRASDEVGAYHWDYDINRLKVFMKPQFVALL